MKEVVVDTNVFVSALISAHGTPRTLLTKISRGEVGLVLSPRLLLEIVSVFSRSKLRTLIPERRISDMVALIHETARIVKAPEAAKSCRDPKDNAVLDCAVAGKAHAIVTGDGDLLCLHPFSGIPILTPRDFLETL